MSVFRNTDLIPQENVIADTLVYTYDLRLIDGLIYETGLENDGVLFAVLECDGVLLARMDTVDNRFSILNCILDSRWFKNKSILFKVIREYHAKDKALKVRWMPASAPMTKTDYGYDNRNYMVEIYPGQYFVYITTPHIHVVPRQLANSGYNNYLMLNFTSESYQYDKFKKEAGIRDN